jgi:glycine C-acetyltransferase
MDSFHSMFKFLQQLEEAPTIICAESLPSPEFRCEGRKFISFSSNNYLSLASHPRMIAAAKRGLEEYGVANCESRLLGGDLDVYRLVEEKLALLKRTENAILFATGYMTNLGALSSFTRSAQVLRVYGYRQPQQHRVMFFSDQFSHLSMREGIRMSGGDKATYPHLNLQRLEDLLKRNDAAVKIIVTDGVFSHDGDIAPLPELIQLAEKYDALVYVDDAHGTGVLGRNGGGISEYFDLFHPRMIHMGTLSKAYGAIGGFIAAGSEITEVIRVTSSPYGFTSTLPPDQAFAVSEAMDIVRDEPERRERLWRNQRHFSNVMRMNEFCLVCDQTPIVPVLIGSEVLTQKYSDELHRLGFHVDTVKFPAVGMGKARLRFILNTNHTPEQIDRVILAMTSIRSKLEGHAACEQMPAATAAIGMQRTDSCQ